jgi:hypothetical protein
MYKQNLDVLMDGTYVFRKIFVSLAKVAPQPSYSHLNGLIPRCTESICLFRSVELGNILSHPSHVHSWTFASWTFFTWRVILLIDGNVISHPSTVHSNRSGYQYVVFTWDVTHPEFRTSSRIQDVYIDTVSTSSAPCRRAWVRLHAKVRRIARNHKVAISWTPSTWSFRCADTWTLWCSRRTDRSMAWCQGAHHSVSQPYHVGRFWTYSPGTCKSGSYQWESPSTSLVS